MKKLFLIFIFTVFALTSCDKNPETLLQNIDVDNIDNKDIKTFSGINQDDIINDETTDEDNDEILAQTFLLDFMQTDREFKSGIIHDDTLQIILLSNGNLLEEFELFNGQTPSTTLTLCDALGIKTINLKVVDNSENPIFEITYSNNKTKYLISPDYENIIN